MLRRFLSLTAAAVLAVGLAGVPVQAKPDDVVSIVRVTAPTKALQVKLIGLDLDLMDTEGTSINIMLHGARDEAKLRGAGFAPQVLVADVTARNRAARQAEEARARSLAASPLPTGRVSYRTLSETNTELMRLARAYPDRVKRFALPNRSLLDQTVWGLEITHDVHADDGKPVFLMTGLHHSREWPTVELTMEFVWDVLKNDRVDPRITSLLDRSRLIVVPIVNPDGFDMSRSLVQEQKRKNCRVTDGQRPTWVECADPANFDKGVDLNRNYGAFWGGPGAGASGLASNYRGQAPFSEPEIRNIRELISAKQVTVAISNHTPDARVLRVPSAPNEPRPADEGPYDALAQALGADMKWPAGPWPEIYYVASGTTEETAYYSAGTFAFTFEHTPGGRGFHPPYPFVIDQYFGTGAYPGSSARAAFLTAFEAAADPAKHSVITGKAPRGAKLTVQKNFTLDTSPVTNPDGSTGLITPFPYGLRSTLSVDRDGKFDWHVNPSLRPSQYLQKHLNESWTLTCHRPGGRTMQVQVTVARGAVAEVDLSRCGRR
nr:M14 family zinc carboxypeptidase [Kibdelosporangium sp. MJ126-NF4]CEL18127.1 Carboxypeptidase T precursor [Kibdelosporangium sp. MJ126-NF4]CTQ90644.1 Carboxypeptidase T precursor (EC 3.4.17.18) [Kibdelosporangium sp. MJ126-NF4]